jgi:radical SAM superfamily enzyme YgiQ (UPF0313 family)
MKIKLITPRMSLRPMDSEYKRVLSPSLAFLILASLTPKEHHLRIEDGNTQPIILDDRPDLVGISVNVDGSPHAYDIASGYRRRGIPVIFGGIHASANPEEALQHADSVCIGEAEELWGTILNDAAHHRLRKEYRNDIPVDPARIPLPRWDLLDQSRYLYTNILFTSRGCPFQCDFCYNSCDYIQHHYRNRPVETVLREIERLGTRHVMFIDDNFAGNPDWTKRFVRTITPLRLKWNAAVSANIAQHPDLLDDMEKSGCQSLFIGFESINGRSTASVHKHQNNRSVYERLIREIHRRGIMVNASMVFGFDHDGPNVFPDTLDWLVANKVETMTAHILTPYPGTRLYSRWKAEGRIVDFDPAHYNTAHVVFTPRHMTQEELYNGYLWIYREFYSFRNILKRLPDAPRQRIPYLLFALGYRKFGNITSKAARIGLTHVLGRLARRLSYGVD